MLRLIRNKGESIVFELQFGLQGQNLSSSWELCPLAGIWAMWLRLKPKGWDLGVLAEVWAFRGLGPEI